MRVRAVIVSESFGDLLAVTLPRNRRHFSEVLVVTSPRDEVSRRVAETNGAEVFLTESFWRGGAPFAKFSALESALDEFGRWGVISLVDADTIWPSLVPLPEFPRGKIVGFRRRRLHVDVTKPVPPETDWGTILLDPQDPKVHQEVMGFTQIFHADDPRLGSPPWHDVTLPTAALGDSKFQAKWKLSEKIWMDADVLHLGKQAENWCGRVTPYTDGTLPHDADRTIEENRNLIRRLWPAADIPPRKDP